MESTQIFEAEKEDLKADIEKIKKFINKGYLDLLPLDLSGSLKNILISELNCLETEKNQIEKDLIEITINRAETDRY